MRKEKTPLRMKTVVSSHHMAGLYLVYSSQVIKVWLNVDITALLVTESNSLIIRSGKISDLVFIILKL